MNNEVKPCPFCGGQPRLRKGSRPSTETVWRHEEWKDYDADGSYVIRQRDYQVVVPKVAVTHYVKCPKCKTETAEYGTKTRAVDAWNKRVNKSEEQQ